MADIAQRKADHLDLASRGDVGFRRGTLFECVELVHDALPELGFDTVDLGTTLFGKRLRVPLLIAGMTGGHERAQRINRELAALAEERGWGFGLGSQRAMLKNTASSPTYRIREVAPTALVLGNIGIVQASGLSSDVIGELVEAVGADALCVHLNPAMELVQEEGDRDFRGGLTTLERLVHELEVPIVVKETGCGIAPRVARRLREAGVRHLDVSGAGGTSWVAVEAARASVERRPLGETYREWGIPTAASVALCAPLGFETLIASGGVSTGLEVAKAIALGASAGALARPILQALDREGRAGAAALLKQLEAELRTALVLTGSPNLESLRRAPRVVLGELTAWVEQLSRD